MFPVHPNRAPAVARTPPLLNSPSFCKSSRFPDPLLFILKINVRELFSRPQQNLTRYDRRMGMTSTLTVRISFWCLSIWALEATDSRAVKRSLSWFRWRLLSALLPLKQTKKSEKLVLKSHKLPEKRHRRTFKKSTFKRKMSSRTENGCNLADVYSHQLKSTQANCKPFRAPSPVIIHTIRKNIPFNTYRDFLRTVNLKKII